MEISANTTTNPPHNSPQKSRVATSQEDILMSKMMKFYKEEYNLNLILPIICGTHKISLRVLDWFVTNYAKQYNILYNIKKTYQILQFSVHNSYKSQLKTFSKKGFDPFCRRQRIFFEYAKGEGVETTVGQLNFFKWAIENKVIDYVESHFDEIVEDMNTRCSKPKDGKKRELSISGTKSINQHDVKITLKFDL